MEDPQHIMLSERSRTQKTTYCEPSYRIFLLKEKLERQKTEQWLPGVGCGNGDTPHRTFWGEGSSLSLDCGDGCTTVSIS